MDTGCDSQTSKSLLLLETNYVSDELLELDMQEESPLATMASNLVHEWLNQALDNFELTFGNTLYQSNICTRNGNRNENRANDILSDLVESSVPSLKQPCHEALETLDNHLMNVSVSQWYGEEKQAYSKHMSGTEAFLCRSMKEVESLESENAGNHSQHNSAWSGLKACDFSNLHNLLVTDTDKAEVNAVKVSHEVLQNDDIGDETLNQVQTSVHQLLPAIILNVASSAVEDMSDSFNADVNSHLDCASAHTRELIDSQDQNGNIAYKVTDSSSDMFPADDLNSGNSGSQICLFGPGVQVSFSLLHLLLASLF